MTEKKWVFLGWNGGPCISRGVKRYPYLKYLEVFWGAQNSIPNFQREDDPLESDSLQIDRKFPIKNGSFAMGFSLRLFRGEKISSTGAAEGDTTFCGYPNWWTVNLWSCSFRTQKGRRNDSEKVSLTKDMDPIVTKNCQEKANWCEILGAFFGGSPLSIPAIYIFVQSLGDHRNITHFICADACDLHPTFASSRVKPHHEHISIRLVVMLEIGFKKNTCFKNYAIIKYMHKKGWHFSEILRGYSEVSVF